MNEEVVSKEPKEEIIKPQWAKILLKLCKECKIDLVNNYATNTN